MGFRAVFQFFGLCHFIENRDDNVQLCRICVLLPRIPIDIIPRPHIPQLLYHERYLYPPVPNPKMFSEPLISKRVTFRFLLEDDRKLKTKNLTNRLKDTVAVDELTELPSQGYFPFAGATPHPSIDSLVLLHEGTLTEEEPLGDWEIGHRETRKLPTFSKVAVGDDEAGYPILRELDVYLTPFGSDEAKVLRFVAPSNGVVPLTFSADCKLRKDRRPPPRIVRERTPDDDYRSHYLYFLDFSSRVRVLPVPAQLARPKDEASIAKENIKKNRDVLPRYEMKIPSKARPRSGGGVYLHPETGLIVVNGGGGSDCQNGRQIAKVALNLDTFIKY